MATSCAWLSVIVKRGQQVIHPRTIVKCDWDDRFCSLLVKLGGSKYEETQVTKVQISRTEKFLDPVHVVPLDAPVILCEQFNCYNVCVYVAMESGCTSTNSTSLSATNAFGILMSAASTRALPPCLEPPEGKELRADQRLFNDLLGRFLNF